MTREELYDGILCIQGEAGIDLNGGGDRDVEPALRLIGEFERPAMARAIRWAADQVGKEEGSLFGMDHMADLVERGEVTP